MNLFPFPAPFWREKAYCVEPKYLTLKEEDNKWNTKNIEVQLDDFDCIFSGLEFPPLCIFTCLLSRKENIYKGKLSNYRFLCLILNK